MMILFIYVFDKDSKEKMLELGYDLLKESEDGQQCVFNIDENFTYSLSDVKYVMSDILTF